MVSEGRYNSFSGLSRGFISESFFMGHPISQMGRPTLAVGGPRRVRDVPLNMVISAVEARDVPFNLVTRLNRRGTSQSAIGRVPER
jgi:hypothetical protein